MYEVLTKFADLSDGKYLYNEGDAFPRSGKRVSDKRIKELMGSNNKMKRPLIRESVPAPSVDAEDNKADKTPPKKTEAKGKQRKKRESK